LGSGQAIEGLGQESLRLGSELGGKASTAGANAGQFLFTGGSNAALTRQQAGGFSPEAGLLQGLSRNRQFTQGVQNFFSPPKNYFDSMGNEFSASGTPIYDY